MAKCVSVSVAIVFNWIGNRYWTFLAYRRRGVLLEFLEYGLVSLGTVFRFLPYRYWSGERTARR